MKLLLGSLFLVISSLSVACDGPGGGELEDCVTSYTGRYEGDRSGRVSGRLTYARQLRLTFIEGDNELPRDTDVDEDGNVSGTPEGSTISGSFNFDDCTAEGTWEEDGDSMTWSIDLP